MPAPAAARVTVALLVLGTDGPDGRRATQSATQAALAPCTSFVPWRALMRRTLGFDPLDYPRYHATTKPIAIITNQDVVAKILQHLHLPPTEPPSCDEPYVRYDVTDEPIPEWVVGVDPDERGPPADGDGIDPPASDEFE